MNIAFASGKGGAGKTTLSTAAALVLSRKLPVQYVDLDVEEPDGHIFLKPEITGSFPAEVLVPRVDMELCNFCGDCGQFCAFGAIAALPADTMVFPKLCHSCGGCMLVCPRGAISEVPRQIGVVETGDAGSVKFLHGRLNVGEAMAPPLIEAVYSRVDHDRLVIMDSPPGANCSTATVISRADLVVLVAEPTPFGLNDLEIAAEMIRLIDKPFGVIVNRHGLGDGRVEEWCREQDVPLWGKVPFSEDAARLIASGSVAAEIVKTLGEPLKAAMSRLPEVTGL